MIGQNMEWIAPLLGLLVVGGLSLTGLRMWLHRPQRSTLAGEDVNRLVDSVESLQEQVHQLRGDVADLHERIDFAERLLAKGGE